MGGAGPLRHSELRRGIGIFNGDMGIVREINEQTERVTGRVRRTARCVDIQPHAALEELELAYAVTIHKSQGSEYPAMRDPAAVRPQTVCL